MYLLQGTKIGATLWQELFPEFEPKLRCGGAYVIQNVKVVDTHSDYKVSAIKYLVYFVKTTSVKEVDRPEIPPNVHAITSFADIISGVAKPDTLVGMQFIFLVHFIVRIISWYEYIQHNWHYCVCNVNRCYWCYC